MRLVGMEDVLGSFSWGKRVTRRSRHRPHFGYSFIFSPAKHTVPIGFARKNQIFPADSAILR
jgi:hypothetical protein